MTAAQMVSMAKYVASAMRKHGFVFDEDDVRQDVQLALWEKFREKGMALGPGTFAYYFKVAWRRATNESARAMAPASIPAKNPRAAASAYGMRTTGPKRTDAIQSRAVDGHESSVLGTITGQRLLDALAGAVLRSKSPDKRAALRFIRGGLTPGALSKATAVSRSQATWRSGPDYLIRRQVRQAFKSSTVAQEARWLILAS